LSFKVHYWHEYFTYNFAKASVCTIKSVTGIIIIKKKKDVSTGNNDNNKIIKNKTQ